jgi:putative ABC transport system permease protein
MLKLALRNVFRQKLRTGMTMAAIVLGVVALILSGGFVQDVYYQLGESLIHSQSGHVQVSRAGFQAHGTRSPEKFLIGGPDSVRQALVNRSEVDDVMARINFSGLISNGRSNWPIVGEGVEPDKEAKLGTHFKVVEGRRLEKGDAYGVVVGDGVAQALKLRIGEHATLLLNTAEGALNSLEFEVVGTFQSFSKEYDSRAVRISLAAAHELLGTQGVNSLVMALKRTADTQKVTAAVASQLDNKQFEVRTWEQLNDFYASTVALYERQFGVLQVIILVMVLLSVGNSVNMSAFERVGEFGTMMALGNRSGVVFRLVLTENVVLGLCGGGLGVALGLIFAGAISAVGIPMPPPPNANIGYIAHIRVLPSTVVEAFGVGLCATLLAALFPAWRVSRTAVVDALRQNV